MNKTFSKEEAIMPISNYLLSNALRVASKMMGNPVYVNIYNESLTLTSKDHYHYCVDISIGEIQKDSLKISGKKVRQKLTKSLKSSNKSSQGAK